MRRRELITLIGGAGRGRSRHAARYCERVETRTRPLRWIAKPDG